MRFSLALSVALGAATLGVAQPSRRTLSLNPDTSAIRPIPDTLVPAAKPLTNAERFALNMPPAQPKAHRRRSRDHGVAPRGGSRVASARRAGTSPLPLTSAKCNILVKGSDGFNFGYIGRTLDVYGQYGSFGPSETALEVSFSYSLDSSAQLDLLATNGQSATYPYLGAVVDTVNPGSDLGTGNVKFASLTGTTQAPAGPPAKGNSAYSMATGISGSYESAIWSYNPITQAITAQWINTDRSTPSTRIAYADDSAALFLTGDLAAMNDASGTAYPEVTFTCVPPNSGLTS